MRVEALQIRNSSALRVAPVGWAATSNSVARLTALEFLELVGRGELTTLEYARACADVIDAFEPHLKAWAHYDRTRFEMLAAEADRSLSKHRKSGAAGLPGPAFGVPVGVKDIFNTEDMPTSHGSSLFADYTPGNDARVVTHLRRAGALMAGKTVTAEFAVHTPNGTRNPHDYNRSAGTSSSGSAVAVATAMVPVALASQTAGSIIRPASYTGVVGFKPSYGTIPRTAMLKTTDTLDSVGCMSRSIDDIALIFDLLRVKGENYPVIEAGMCDPSRHKTIGTPWRVAVVEGPKSHLEAPAVKAKFSALASQLHDAGCEISILRLPAEFNVAHDIHETIYRRSLGYYFRKEWESRRCDFSSSLAEMVESGTRIDLQQYQLALAAQTDLAKLYDRLLSDIDVVICPSTADEAPVGFETPDIPDHCLIFTMCYAPSISLPLLHGSTGLPVGLQIASRRFSDFKLLEFARFAHRIRPDLS